MWEETRNEPLRTFKWGVDSLQDVKFNPVQKDLLGISILCILRFYYTFLIIYIFFSQQFSLHTKFC